MPIYEYQCTSCAHRFEVKQSIKDEPIKECARCGKEVTKLISSPAIMFKGSGWYITDYSDKMKPGSGSDTSEKPAASTTDKTKAPASSEGGSTSSTTTPAPAAAAASSSTASTSTSTSTSSPSTSGSSSSSSSST
ncbi:MAG: transcriptional regulator [Nitrospira sp.]|nr:transcriptional regulator [Nitrospira sp.]MCS6264167.1 hypothetical protein [Nitrospira sp.]